MCIPNQLQFIKVDRQGERGRGCRAERENREAKCTIWMESLLETVHKKLLIQDICNICV